MPIYMAGTDYDKKTRITLCLLIGPYSTAIMVTAAVDVSWRQQPRPLSSFSSKFIPN